ncbi:MAG: hypothetical protein LBC92_04265, partial [Rickettsiales bacterium]|nr:hypothetical protein [Rickettsiales bacterium]
LGEYQDEWKINNVICGIVDAYVGEKDRYSKYVVEAMAGEVFKEFEIDDNEIKKQIRKTFALGSTQYDLSDDNTESFDDIQESFLEKKNIYKDFVRIAGDSTDGSTNNIIKDDYGEEVARFCVGRDTRDRNAVAVFTGQNDGVLLYRYDVDEDKNVTLYNCNGNPISDEEYDSRIDDDEKKCRIGEVINAVTERLSNIYNADIKNLGEGWVHEKFCNKNKSGNDFTEKFFNLIKNSSEPDKMKALENKDIRDVVSSVFCAEEYKEYCEALQLDMKEAISCAHFLHYQKAVENATSSIMKENGVSAEEAKEIVKFATGYLLYRRELSEKMVENFRDGDKQEVKNIRDNFTLDNSTELDITNQLVKLTKIFLINKGELVNDKKVLNFIEWAKKDGRGLDLEVKYGLTQKAINDIKDAFMLKDNVQVRGEVRKLGFLTWQVAKSEQALINKIEDLKKTQEKLNESLDEISENCTKEEYNKLVDAAYNRFMKKYNPFEWKDGLGLAGKGLFNLFRESKVKAMRRASNILQQQIDLFNRVLSKDDNVNISAAVKNWGRITPFERRGEDAIRALEQYKKNISKDVVKGINDSVRKIQSQIKNLRDKSIQKPDSERTVIDAESIKKAYKEGKTVTKGDGTTIYEQEGRNRDKRNSNQLSGRGGGV